MSHCVVAPRHQVVHEDTHNIKCTAGLQQAQQWGPGERELLSSPEAPSVLLSTPCISTSRGQRPSLQEGKDKTEPAQVTLMEGKAAQPSDAAKCSQGELLGPHNMGRRKRGWWHGASITLFSSIHPMVLAGAFPLHVSPSLECSEKLPGLAQRQAALNQSPLGYCSRWSSGFSAPPATAN